MEQILAWKKAYSQLQQQHDYIKKVKNDQLTSLNNQLFLLESCLKRKQKHIAQILMQSECAIVRQQKIINSLSSRLNKTNKSNSYDSKALIEFDENLNDSDSAVVLEDQEDTDSMGTNSLTRYRRKEKSCSPGVTVMRSISDTINSNLCKFAFRGARRSDSMSCRSDVSDVTSNFDEDAVHEAIDKISNSETSSSHFYDYSDSSDNNDTLDRNHNIYHLQMTSSPYMENRTSPDRKTGTQLIKYNRVMSNHRSVTKPKDVKYKRINKAKSKSLEELRGKLKHWVENGSVGIIETQKTTQSVV